MTADLPGKSIVLSKCAQAENFVNNGYLPAKSAATFGFNSNITSTRLDGFLLNLFYLLPLVTRQSWDHHSVTVWEDGEDGEEEEKVEEVGRYQEKLHPGRH